LPIAPYVHIGRRGRRERHDDEDVRPAHEGANAGRCGDGHVAAGERLRTGATQAEEPRRNPQLRLTEPILFEQLLPRLASIELTGPPARLRSNFTNGLKRLPVRIVTV
jgi:hypothetical protein